MKTARRCVDRTGGQSNAAAHQPDRPHTKKMGRLPEQASHLCKEVYDLDPMLFVRTYAGSMMQVPHTETNVTNRPFRIAPTQMLPVFL